MHLAPPQVMLAIRGIGEAFTITDAFQRTVDASNHLGFSQDLATYLKVSGIA